MLHSMVTSLKMFVLVRLYKNMTCRFVFLRRQTDLRHAANRRHAVRGESRCRRARMGCKGAGVPTAIERGSAPVRKGGKVLKCGGTISTVLVLFQFPP